MLYFVNNINEKNKTKGYKSDISPQVKEEVGSKKLKSCALSKLYYTLKENTSKSQNIKNQCEFINTTKQLS